MLKFKPKLILLISLLSINWGINEKVIAGESRIFQNRLVGEETRQSSLIIRDIKFEGNTIYTDSQLQKLLAPYIGLPVTPSVLENIAKEVTDLYVQDKYITSFASVPITGVQGDIVNVEIIEGKIDNINVEIVGGYLKPEYVRSRLEKRLPNKIFNSSLLDNAIIDLPIVDENILQLNVDVKVNISRPEVVDLEVLATVTRGLSLKAFLANTGSPTVGEIGLGTQLSTRIFGNGDRFIVSASFYEGTNGYSAFYSMPINPSNTTIFASVNFNDSNAISRPFDFVNIEVESIKFDIGIFQPIIVRRNERLTLGLTVTSQESIGTIEGEGAQLFQGADEDGKLKVISLRLPLNYSYRTPDDKNIVNIGSELSIGIDALGATINDEGFADGRYATFRFSGNYARILDRDTFVNATVNFQLAQNTLPVFEKFNLGGLDRVPGYREGKLSTDNGVNAKLELFVPVYRNEKETVLVQVIPFVAFGKGWDNFEFPNPRTNNLFSVGAGVNFRLSDRFRVRLNLGIPFTNRNDITGDRTLSDDGFNFGFEGTILNF